MALKSAPYYWIECDGCGKRCDYDDYSAWDNSRTAIDYAIEADWTTDGERRHCGSCPGLFKCEKCGKPAGDLCGERDYHCPKCHKEAEASL